MSIKASLSKNALYLVAVIILSGGIYGICDYYLHSVAKELMLNWAETEAIAIQEGNLLTSITKTQRFLISSSYIKGVKLVKVANDDIESKIEFGSPFSLSAVDFSDLDEELTQKRIGFLHQRAFYQIPKKDGMVLVFDVQSGFLIFLFAVSSTLIILLVVYLIWALQRLEKNEVQKREHLLKIAISDLLFRDSPSETLEKEIPDLIKWWKFKKKEIEESKKISVEHQSKILLGEIASRAVHDIKGSLRNVREISKLAQGLTPPQKSIIEKSLDKISKISQNLLSEAKEIHSEENKHRTRTNLNAVISEVVHLKQAQYGSAVLIDLKLPENNVVSVIDPVQLDRSISNLIDNAIEASKENSVIKIKLNSDTSWATIQIADSGIGISKEHLQKIGVRGFTYGKANGTGLGLFYAKRLIEDLGGKFNIESTVNKGTTISMSLPTSHFVMPDSINFGSSEHILILEDQALIRDTVRFKFNNSGVPTNAYSIFSTPSELESWMTTNNSNFKLYSDYYLENDKGEKIENGVNVIKRLGIADRSCLFTSAFNEPEVIRAAQGLGIPVLSKDQFFGLDVKLRSM